MTFDIGMKQIHVMLEAVMNSPRVNVWCALSKNCLIESFFFKDDVINGKIYLAMLQSFFIPEAEVKENPINHIPVRRSTPYFSSNVRQFFNEHFPNRGIGRGGPVRWTPRSPNLAPLALLVWNYVMNKVYTTPVNDMSDLKERIIMK